MVSIVDRFIQNYSLENTEKNKIILQTTKQITKDYLIPVKDTNILGDYGIYIGNPSSISISPLKRTVEVILDEDSDSFSKLALDLSRAFEDILDEEGIWVLRRYHLKKK